MNKNKIAFIYDLDGTLVDGFLSAMCLSSLYGIEELEHWNSLTEKAKKLNADPLLLYMLELRNIINEHKPLNMTLQEYYNSHADKAILFPGVVSWFDNVNKLGEKYGLEVEHFIVSSGLKGQILALPFADKLTAVYANEFMCDENNQPVWLSICVSSSAKTEHVYRISKGCFDLSKTSELFDKSDKDTRYVRFENMIYIGDGETDIPAMKVVGRKGGQAIAVYKEDKKDYAQKLLDENRVNFITVANYEKGKELYNYVEKIFVAKSQKKG